MTDTRDVAYIRKRLCDASDLMSEVFVRAEDMSKENVKLKEVLKNIRKEIAWTPRKVSPMEYQMVSKIVLWINQALGDN